MKNSASRAEVRLGDKKMREIITFLRKFRFYRASSIERLWERILKNPTTENQYAKENRQKWTLTVMAFDKLLLCLDTDGEKSGEKYLLLRRNLVRFFLKDVDTLKRQQTKFAPASVKALFSPS